MELDKLTIGEAKELAKLFGGSVPIRTAVDHGKCIVIADRGWIWVGDCVERDGYMNITNSKNIRQWGATRGLGEIAENGPTSKTILDPSGAVRVAMRAVIGLIPVRSGKWN